MTIRDLQICRNRSKCASALLFSTLFTGITLWLISADQGNGEQTQKHYFAHDTVEDQNGVIAPWYKGQNGQFDFRARVAAETIKRYPWAPGSKTVKAGPEYVFNGNWNIDSEGKITIPVEKDWNNGDLAQRGAYTISSMLEYYRYSGDPAGLKSISSTIDYILSHCQTSSTHGWPNILISVPTMGVAYHDCRLGLNEELASGNGKIQLDIVAEFGLQLIHAYEVTGNIMWYQTAKHWADLLVKNRRLEPGASPWGRYADNVGGAGMNGVQTGGVAMILWFFDELIRTGYRGIDGGLIVARDAGRKYMRDVLLPVWYVDDTWGRHFWDWENPVQTLYPTDYASVYMMDHKDYFTNWKNDVRNILGLNLNHTSVNPLSNGDNYSGAWAYPESSSCCNRSLSYSPQELARAFARYGVEAGSEWGREIARRSETITTYDGQENGQAMDNIDGGSIVDGTWFKIAQPMALDYALKTMGWLPEVMGPNRENHIMRTSGVVTRVIYGAGEILYSTFDAPPNSVDVLRLAYSPAAITANGAPLKQRADLATNGYTVRQLNGGDTIVSIRHDGALGIAVKGPDPQVMVDDAKLTFMGNWEQVSNKRDYRGASHTSSQVGSSLSYRFKGNQVRLVGAVGKYGGLADVYLDGTRQLAGIDNFSPTELHQQVLYYRNGLSNDFHTLKVVVRGESNPIAEGKEVYVDGLQYSEASGDSGLGVGGGPKDAQRFLFGYTARRDYVDSQGQAWRPGTEFIARRGDKTGRQPASDAVANTWWTMRQAVFVRNVLDPELYRYGIHSPDFTVNVTVGPGRYHVRLKFAETQVDGPDQRGITIYLNGAKAAGDLDVWKTAGGADKGVDLVYNNIDPVNGVIAIRFEGSTLSHGCKVDAMVQAIEVAPGDGGKGETPQSVKLSQ
jgi:hypothetical protein